jgi:vacuolar-type H+-ATPase subunit I/STV1
MLDLRASLSIELGQINAELATTDGGGPNSVNLRKIKCQIELQCDCIKEVLFRARKTNDSSKTESIYVEKYIELSWEDLLNLYEKKISVDLHDANLKLAKSRERHTNGDSDRREYALLLREKVKLEAKRQAAKIVLNKKLEDRSNEIEKALDKYILTLGDMSKSELNEVHSSLVLKKEKLVEKLNSLKRLELSSGFVKARLVLDINEIKTQLNACQYHFKRISNEKKTGFNSPVHSIKAYRDKQIEAIFYKRVLEAILPEVAFTPERIAEIFSTQASNLLRESPKEYIEIDNERIQGILIYWQGSL